MAAIVLLLWAGSIISGWLNFYWWLVLPPAIFLLHVIRFNRRMGKAYDRNGLPKDRLIGNMLGPNITLIATAILQNSALFGVSALVHYLFR
jgi:hypothetical protein